MAWYRSKDERKENRQYSSDMELLEDVLNGHNIENIDYLLCTSLVDVGVEIQLKEKPIVIDFIDNTSTIIDDIQFVGRFRQGIEQLYLVGKLDKDNPITKPLNLINEYNNHIEESKNVINTLNSFNEETINPLSTASIIFNNDTLMYELNEYGLMQYVFKKYINFYLQTDIYLKLFLEKHQTFNTKEISIVDYNSLNIIESEELKDEKKKIKDTIKEQEKEFYNNIKVFDLTDKILKMILNIDDVDNKDLWKIKNYDDICNRWKHEELEEYRKRYNEISEILKNNKIKEIDKLKIALSQKNINNLKKQINYINYNLLYKEDKTLKALNKDMLITYKIRDYINKTKGKERGVYLSNKFKEELLQELQKEKSLSKISPKQLDKHLKLIYILSNNNNNERISSVKNSV